VLANSTITGGTMNTFKPADDYESLKKQAYALFSLAKSKEQQISLLNKTITDLKRTLSLTDAQALAQERATNEQLTNQLLKAEAEIEQFKSQIASITLDINSELSKPTYR
jgi:predicted  nucleic acid-binding Zn-ribbon protein